MPAAVSAIADDLIAVRALAEAMTGAIHFVLWPQPAHIGQFWFFHAPSVPGAGKWPPTLHRLYTLSVIYGRDYDRLASLCGVPASEALKEHKKLVLPRTYLIGPAPEKHKSTALSAVELREKLRAERTNLVPKMIETWDEVPLVLQQMDGSSPLSGRSSSLNSAGDTCAVGAKCMMAG